MFIKRKNRSVIFFSSVIIIAVILSTLIGHSLYIQFKKDSLSSSYRNSIYEMTADLFRNDVEISNLKMGLRKEGPFSEKPFIEGSLKNNSEKTLKSILIEVSFVRPDGEVVYKDQFYPLGGKPLGSGGIDVREVVSGNLFFSGKSVLFQHVLKKCPHDLAEEFIAQTKFAKGDPDGKIKLVCFVKGLIVL